MSKEYPTIAQKTFEQGKGILRLVPNWVPRSFCIPGRRIKLHPDDYYALGGVRGGIDERWFSSTTPADNGPLTVKWTKYILEICWSPGYLRFLYWEYFLPFFNNGVE